MRGIETKEKGSVLILTLWALVVLSFFAVHLSEGVRQKVLVEKRLDERDQLRKVSEAGIKSVLTVLNRNDRHKVLSLKDLNDDELMKAMTGRVGRGEYKIHPFAPRDRTGSLIIDENRKINVNAADYLTLKTLFQYVAHAGDGSASALAYAIMDYRDEDDHVRGVFDGGSEVGSYSMARLPYGPKNADFEFVAELLRVKGMTHEIYLAVFDYVTVYGDGKININTADKNILSLVLENGSLVEKIVSVRKGFDGQEGTGDDFIFSKINTLEQDIRNFYELTDVEVDALNRSAMYGKVAVTSDHFRIVSEAMLDKPQAIGSVACIYGMGQGIQYWMET